MEKLRNGCWKLYFIQLSPNEGGEVVYKIGVTEYFDVLARFSSYENEFVFKVLCSVVFSSETKAKAFESALLTIYNKIPKKEIFERYNSLIGQGEIRDLSIKEKMEILNFMFHMKDKKPFAI